MTVDPWGAATPQQFPAQNPDVFARVAELLAANRREMFDTRASILANVSSIVADLTSQLATLTTTVNDLASRVTQTVTIPTFNTGSLPNDGTRHPYGSSFAITIAVPTGKLVVTIGCGQATLNAGGVAVEADATFSISGGVASMLDYYSSAYLGSSTTGVGVPLNVQRSFSVTPGTYTITGQMYAWTSGTATASVNFQQPFLTVQVTG